MNTDTKYKRKKNGTKRYKSGVFFVLKNRGERGASWGELTLCVGVQLGRTALHYAAVLTDESTLYNTLKEAGADETITDSVSILCF